LLEHIILLFKWQGIKESNFICLINKTVYIVYRMFFPLIYTLWSGWIKPINICNNSHTYFCVMRTLNICSLTSFQNIAEHYLLQSVTLICNLLDVIFTKCSQRKFKRTGNMAALEPVPRSLCYAYGWLNRNRSGDCADNGLLVLKFFEKLRVKLTKQKRGRESCLRNLDEGRKVLFLFCVFSNFP
jgi:hypothetical protein